eukprot:CAMPEP_0170816564 /NCGR_PEP_ID=MMETSP0733-20121128/39360_1 /TAXON_ID=186038 /ORGANISM="Fragilariopsis kerguelensis, Strain L26-C5" /LENGTH=414 /DNA_ID=CAMNT_0011175799 /DNA_START=91 /DNA_END=1331 /DNA_ORIENTATION=+
MGVDVSASASLLSSSTRYNHKADQAVDVEADQTLSNNTTKGNDIVDVDEDLFVDLQTNNLFFDELVDKIPTKLYSAGQSGADDYNPKYWKGHSKESKVTRKAKNKQLSKRATFDPATLAKRTTETKQRLENDNNHDNKLTPQKPGMNKKGDNFRKSVNATITTVTTTISPDIDNKSRIEALREKLHAKLAEKRGNRPSDPNTISKRAARRAEKKKRQAEAIQRNKKKSTSNAEKDNNNKRFKMSNNSGEKGDPATDLAQVDFGRLAGLNPIGNSNYTEVNKALKNLSKSKNLEKLLADAENKKQRLEELKKSGKQEDKKKAANIEWGNMIKEATGERVKDDPAKIKKTLKRKAVKKQKSAKAWKTRMESTQQKMDERQNIRNHNLNKRKEGGSVAANLSSKRIEVEGDNKNDKT